MDWYPDDYDDTLDDFYEEPWEDYEEEPPYYNQPPSRSPYADVPDEDLYFMAMEGDIGAEMEIFDRQRGYQPVSEPSPELKKAIWTITFVILGLFFFICLLSSM